MRGMFVRKARLRGIGSGTHLTAQSAAVVDRSGSLVKPGRRRALLACAAIALLVGLGLRLSLPGEHQTLPSRTIAPAPSRAATAGLSRLPASARGPVSASLGASAGGYLITPGPHGLHAANPAQQLQTSFSSSRGVLVSSAGTRVGLDLSAIGYGSALRPVDRVNPTAHLNRVSYGHGSVGEWYVNGPAGLEQGFSIPRALAGSSSAPLTLRLALSGNAHSSLAADRQSITFSRAGSPAFRYSGLVATDATGGTLRSWLEVRPHELLLRVNAVGAHYPLRIDPFVASGEKITPKAGEEIGSGEFGAGVALSSTGGVLAVGGPGDAEGAGAVWIFTAPGKRGCRAAKS